MKKKLFVMTMILGFFLCGSWAFADDGRCPLTGNTYVFSMEDIDFELSGFDCTFGPGCEATCDLWYGNFETGPVYYMPLPFVCEPTGDVRITIGEAEIPCALNAKGNLECFDANIAGYVCTRLGTKVWCLPEKPGKFQFCRLPCEGVD